MAAKIEGISVPFVPVGGVQGLPRTPEVPETAPSAFRELLQRKLAEKNGIRFSGHAQTRIQSRGIPFNETTIEKLEQAVERAREKGAHDSLILLPEAAFIVNVDNRTVITALDSEMVQESVFTNIDSAIVMK